MHRYLRAVGFSSVQKKEDVDELIRFTSECYQTEETAVTAEGEEFSERRKAFAEQMGLLVREYIMKTMNISRSTVFRILPGRQSVFMKIWPLNDMRRKSPMPESVMI